MNTQGIEHDRSIEHDVTCLGCGYNLRGLRPAGRCPECGGSVEVSLKNRWLDGADPATVRRVRRGLWLLLVSVLLTAGSFGCMGLMWLGEFDVGESWMLAYLALVGIEHTAWLLGCIGVTAARRTDGIGHARPPHRWLGRLTRGFAGINVLAMACVLAGFLGLFLDLVDESLGLGVPVFATPVVFAGRTAAVICLGRFLDLLGGQLPRPELRRGMRWIARTAAAVMVILTAATLTTLAGAIFEPLGSTLVVLPFCFGALALVCIAAAVQLGRYLRAMRQMGRLHEGTTTTTDPIASSHKSHH